MKESTIFSDNIKNKSIFSVDDELAWKLNDVFDAIDEIINNGYAILGGEDWAVVSKQSGHIPLTYINPDEIAIGIMNDTTIYCEKFFPVSLYSHGAEIVLR